MLMKYLSTRDLAYYHNGSMDEPAYDGLRREIAESWPYDTCPHPRAVESVNFAT